MSRFIYLIVVGAGLAVAGGFEPLPVLRYASAAVSFEVARAIAACPACALKLSG